MSGASDRDELAGEYVLGTLEGAEAEEAVHLLATDADFAALVHRWEERLAPLASGISPVEPSPQLWGRIEATTASLAAALPVSTPSLTTAEAQGTATPASVIPLAYRRRLRVWQASTGVAVAIAASLAAFVVLHPRLPTSVAVLAPTKGGEPVLLATADPNGVLSIRPGGSIPVPSDRDLELWALEAGQTQPRSLGVLPPRGERLAAALRPDTQLMVSMEPRGGSPTGRPTGPVLYSGQLVPD
jgi:anti-sigma-K factor RskA